MSFHGLLLGETGSGKSYCASEQLAPSFRREGVGVIAHIPAGLAPWTHADRTIYDSEVFIRTVNASRRCAVFVEMSDAMVSKYNDDFTRLATWARNLGHRCFFIAQRHTQINATLRDQCGMLWLFRVGAKTADLLAEEFVDAKLKDAPFLRGHSHIFKRRGSPAEQVDVP